MVYRFFFGIFLVCLLAGTTGAQPADTLADLPLVTVREDRLAVSSVGRYQKSIDSATTQLLGSTSLGDILPLVSGAQVRSNGPGQSITAGFRAATSVQSAVLWNGLNIQNPTLGQTDLSLIPAVFLDDVRIEYGGGTALWGAGALGGTLHMNNRYRFGTGWDLGGRLNFGSFNRGQGSLRVGHHGGRLSTRNTFFYQGGRNDFPFDSSGTELRRDHARTSQWGALSENQFRIGNRSLLGVSLWYQGAEREVPGSISFPSEGFQDDEVVRVLGTFTHTADRWVWYARLGYFFNRIQFEIPSIDLESDNRGQQWIGEVEAVFQPSSNHRLRIGLNNTWMGGRSDSYPSDATQNRTALFAAYSLSSNDGLWKMTLSGRQGVADGTFNPFVPSLGLEGQVLPWLQISGSVSRNFRLPVLDDLFFQDPFSQGNPDLEAESGWNAEGGVRLSGRREGLQWAVFSRGFSQWIQNLIVWFPDTSFVFSPDNVARVHNRGLETGLEIGLNAGDWSLALTGRYDLIYSTVTESEPESGLEEGAERLVPRSLVTGSLQLGFKSTSLRYWHRYSDVVDLGGAFSTPLNAYNLANLTLSQEVGNPKWRWQTSFYVTIFNLWDADYQQVAGYPQPGRHFEGGIIFNLNRKAVHNLD